MLRRYLSISGPVNFVKLLVTTSGCALDANCAYPKPACGADHLCGCETNADCKPEDYCNSETWSCEPACVTDADCNPGDEGECDVSTNIYTNCHYCDTAPSPNECKPGQYLIHRAL